ncbi:death associated protein 1b isoform X2 [Micropterus dolomieu]|uniref:death associated protein 1b isoform X2 n=1 Tax=Micropterus dolomieu TaxID=147949 RepID=UPI001E8D8E93|nr:death associated protein 1b isoform X2 [Micropterus dolomieu]
MTSSLFEHKNNQVGVEFCGFFAFVRKVLKMVQQLSKSGAKETPMLKAGHPPAVKAGGKRVAKKSLEESGTHGTPEKETKKPDKLRSLATSNRMQQVSILLAGTLDKLSHDFPETPVSVRHSKVRPAMEKTHSPRTFFIQQPRKF